MAVKSLILAGFPDNVKQTLMSDLETIQIFITGGTFDKDYNFITGELYFKDTHMHDMLQRGRCAVPVDIKTLMMIDSLKMTEADREIIAYACDKSPHPNIVITHGTDTMTVTAQFLEQQNLQDKTIVLTGAMIPYAFGTSSDGFFNIGSALAFAQVLPPGVYVAMNGRYYRGNHVTKNKSTGIFESI